MVEKCTKVNKILPCETKSFGMNSFVKSRRNVSNLGTSV